MTLLCTSSWTRSSLWTSWDLSIHLQHKVLRTHILRSSTELRKTKPKSNQRSSQWSDWSTPSLPRCSETSLKHSTWVEAEWCWLLVRYRIQFTIALITVQSLHGLPPLNTELLTLYSASRPLRSDNQSLSRVPQSRFQTKGDHDFTVLAPVL